MNTPTPTNDQAIAALGVALRAIPSAAAAMIMAVAATAAREFADTDDVSGFDATHDAQLCALTAMRVFPLKDTTLAVHVFGDLARTACNYAYDDQD